MRMTSCCEFEHWAPGAVHGPHHIFPEWADKYKGKFDDGWVRVCNSAFAGAKVMSVRDVVVIGGGFAGLTAARELRHAGLDVLLVEARERIGGRTMTTEMSGHTVELGGAYVHWYQPHVWAELTRYGIGVTPSHRPVRAAWVVGDERRESSYAEFDERVEKAVNAICADARSWFPTPHDSSGHEAARLDALSVRQCIDAFDGDAELRMLMESEWATDCSSRCADVSAASAFRWYALSGFDARLQAECLYTYKVDGGMNRLSSAIAVDGSPEVRLDAPVTRVEQTGSGVTVVLRDGEALQARAAVVAAPLNTWTSIDFDPPLSEAKRELGARGHAGHGLKVIVRVRGRHDLSVALSESSLLTWIQFEYVSETETVFVAFGPDGAVLSPTNDAAVREAFESAIPGLDILEVIGHDWEGDPFSRGTWSMYRPGQLTRLVPAARMPEGRTRVRGSRSGPGMDGHG